MVDVRKLIGLSAVLFFASGFVSSVSAQGLDESCVRMLGDTDFSPDQDNPVSPGEEASLRDLYIDIEDDCSQDYQGQMYISSHVNGELKDVCSPKYYGARGMTDDSSACYRADMPDSPELNLEIRAGLLPEEMDLNVENVRSSGEVLDSFSASWDNEIVWDMREQENFELVKQEAAENVDMQCGALVDEYNSLLDSYARSGDNRVIQLGTAESGGIEGAIKDWDDGDINYTELLAVTKASELRCDIPEIEEDTEEQLTREEAERLVSRNVGQLKKMDSDDSGFISEEELTDASVEHANQNPHSYTSENLRAANAAHHFDIELTYREDEISDTEVSISFNVSEADVGEAVKVTPSTPSGTERYSMSVSGAGTGRQHNFEAGTGTLTFVPSEPGFMNASIMIMGEEDELANASIRVRREREITTQENPETGLESDSEDPEGSESSDISIEAVNSGISRGEDVSFNIEIPEDQDHRIVIEGSSGKVSEETVESSGEISLSTSELSLGSYTAKLEPLPEDQSMLGQVATGVESLLGTLPSTEFEIIEGDIPKWMEYCSSEGYDIDDSESLDSCIAEVIETYTNQTDEPIPEETSPIDSMCERWYNMDYSRQEENCIQ